jgi:hypothetical protein
LDQVDDILVFDKGEIIEQGTFKSLMAKKGYLAKLITENVQLLKNEVESDDETGAQDFTNNAQSYDRSISGDKRTPLSVNDLENLTSIQLLNRHRMSLMNNVTMAEQNMAKLIESNKLTNAKDRNLINEIMINRTNSVISMAASENDDIIPSDSEPMRLVLEDQSLSYKVPPILSYLRAGNGVIITILYFALFFLVHLLRILSGEWSFLKFYYFVLNLNFEIKFKIIGFLCGSQNQLANMRTSPMRRLWAPMVLPCVCSPSAFSLEESYFHSMPLKNQLNFTIRCSNRSYLPKCPSSTRRPSVVFSTHSPIINTQSMLSWPIR